MDIALYVSAFLDFETTYAGQTVVDGSPAHLLRVILPMGGVVIYAVDASSYLPVRVDLPEWGVHQRLGDFQLANGVLYPARIWNASDASGASVVKKISVNTDVNRDRFTVPEDIE